MMRFDVCRMPKQRAFDSYHRENDLTYIRIRRHVTMRVTCLIQREHAVNDGDDLAVCQLGQTKGDKIPRERNLLIERGTAQRR